MQSVSVSAGAGAAGVDPTAPVSGELVRISRDVTFHRDVLRPTNPYTGRPGGKGKDGGRMQLSLEFGEEQ
jgi:hypothetical protein